MKVDLHVHTSKSHDGRASLAALAKRAKARGLDGLCICDHNQCTLQHPEQLEGVTLYPGTEVSTTRGHITGLFLEHPLDYPALTGEGLPSPEVAIGEIRRCGGLVVLAHPFASGGADWEDVARLVDGAETYNARAAMKIAEANDLAEAFADRHNLASIGGSDAHSAAEVGNGYTRFPRTAGRMADMRLAVSRREVEAVSVRRTSWLSKGLSQMTSALRSRSPRRIAIGVAYIGSCLVRDIIGG